jgi:ABC-type lipoprotein export system ATPase subunit
VLALEPSHRAAALDRVRILFDLEEWQEAANAARALETLSTHAARAGATLLVATHDARVRERLDVLLALPGRPDAGGADGGRP